MVRIWYMTMLVPSEIPLSKIWHLNYIGTKKDISILTETHTNHDQTHHTRNNWLGLIFFFLGDSHTKGMLFLFHLSLEGITEVDTDPKGRFVSIQVTPIMIEFSVRAPSWYSTREQLARAALFWRTTKLYEK